MSKIIIPTYRDYILKSNWDGYELQVWREESGDELKSFISIKKAKKRLELGYFNKLVENISELNATETLDFVVAQFVSGKMKFHESKKDLDNN